MKIRLLVILNFFTFACMAQVLPALNTNIRLNQVGFYPNCQKLAIVKDAATGPFYVTLPDGSDTVFTGTLGMSANWTYSNENVRVADFSPLGIPGDYILIVPGIGRSHGFKIDNRVHQPVNHASLKAFYYNRNTQAIDAAFGGIYARPLGHPDNNVIILPSAASPGRPAGFSFSAPKGWYDAGDYNKYIVNSGISTYTLLASFEHFPNHYNNLNLNIPESGNAVPDILDEVRWNLDWMLTMQDPGDGGVYNKTTNANFDATIMPDAATNTRYVCAKGTAATFDFAAVMATASRVFLPYDAVFAAQCGTAAVAAYNWGIANPNVEFNNPGPQGGYPGVVTGEYGDDELEDEREWAANELYITTSDNAYYTNGFKNANVYDVPDWSLVNTLGLMSLVHHRKNLTAVGLADTTSMINKLLGLANTLRTGSVASAYKVPMGTRANDWVWGSNGHAANQGMILIQAFRLTSENTYWSAAISSMDYLLGRNATTYSFVTGYGDKTPLHIHHRPSEADGIAAPVPGFLAGGPNTQARYDCGAGMYPSGLPALSYIDNYCSYSTNEITINWNAPFVYLSGALEAINPCAIATLPVDWLSFHASREGEDVLLNWRTANEVNNDYYSVERSEDGHSYKSIGIVEHIASGGLVNEFAFLDADPGKNISYYRIVQYDSDGKYSYSRSVAIHLEHATAFIYPNPAVGNINIKIPSNGIYSVQITDLTGKIVFDGKLNSLGGDSDSIEVGDWKAGIYFLKINYADKSEVHKLVIE